MAKKSLGGARSLSTWLQRIFGELRAPTHEAILQAELFSIGQLEQHARSMAKRHVIDSTRGSDFLLIRLAENEIALRDAYAFMIRAVVLGRRITPAAEWFIDNYHIIEEQIRTARRHLPRGYSRQLPKVTNGLTAGVSRIYDMMFTLISHSHGRVDFESLRAFVDAYQSEKSLFLGELWAIPIMLRLALLENLRRIVSVVTTGRAEREVASEWAERLLQSAATDPAGVVLVLADMIRTNLPLTNAFVAEFAMRLQGHGPGVGIAIAWIEQRLAERGQSLAQVFASVSQSQATDQVAIGNSIGSLRFLNAIDWRDFVEATSVVERALIADPAAIYSLMDFATRDAYRHVIEALAKRAHVDEQSVAQLAIDLARRESRERQQHVGYFLVDKGRKSLELALCGPRQRSPSDFSHPLFYCGFIVILTCALAATVAASLSSRFMHLPMLVGLTVLLIVAFSQLAIALVNWVVTLRVQPRRLPRLDFSRGIAPRSRTLVAVPTLLTSNGEIDELLESLEVRYLANPGQELNFALVTDFRDGPQEIMPDDAELLRHARSGIDFLNKKHQNTSKQPFCLLHRPRRWNGQEGVWMGWERKRGKLEDLNRTLRGDPSPFHTIVGDLEHLCGVKYVIVLDSDTHLPRDAAHQLAGAMAHPLNRPHYDAHLGRVTEGYGILQPRVAITMASAENSRFAGFFAGETGIDPYTRAVSDVYQDLFAEGSFVGKGIYDVDAFCQATAGKMPENRVLSHDLLEGAYARSGLISDVMLFEDYPPTHAADISRRSRWLRGDWQIAAWIGWRVPVADGRKIRSPLSFLSQWKILDNLRRSLVPLALLMLVVIGWLVPTWTTTLMVVVLAVLVIPGVIAATVDLARRPSDLPHHLHGREIAQTLARQLMREGLTLTCLPYEAFIALVATVRASWRVSISHRQLLQWRTAADAQRSRQKHLVGVYVSMAVAPLFAGVLLTVLLVRRGEVSPLASPILAAWALSPALMWWLSKPRVERPHQLHADHVAFLRGVARRTWRFFETYVGPDHNYLPPDNVQEDPPLAPARRTSPTNIGLALTANLAAHDFGYITSAQVLQRTALTFNTLDRLERFRGHFYNWYDTQSLAVLQPMYVSTVDSGNLAGHLLTLAIGLQEFAQHPLVRPQVFEGLIDTIDQAIQAVRASQQPIDDLLEIRRILQQAPTQLNGALQALWALATDACQRSRVRQIPTNAESGWWLAAFETQCQRVLDDLLALAPWLPLPVQIGSDPRQGEIVRLLSAPTLAQVADFERTLVPLLEQLIAAGTMLSSDDRLAVARLRDAVRQGSIHAAAQLTSVKALIGRCQAMADCDYDFLYDPNRHLLAIGYDVGDHRRDASFYDLLASEARLASFVAIAQGKLPQEHWFRLGRLLTSTGRKSVLLSWSGSMFEYLMPLLIMPNFARTLLDETYRGVIERQIAYGRQNHVPWGISESGYNKVDAQLNYQYRAFGVPGLGFKRGLADDLVIAPYASALALMIDPDRAFANLRRLADEGQLGTFGYYEAIDYTASRLPPGKEQMTVRSYMAHHQGMVLLSLTSALLEEPMQRRFAADPSFRATELLLQERVPRVQAITPHPAELSMRDGQTTVTEHNVRVFATPHTSAPAVQLLSNGSYHVAVTNSGSGYSRWRNLAVTRWYEDPTCDQWGNFCYVRDLAHEEHVWSVTHHPTLQPTERYEVVFSLGRVEFRRKDHELDTHVEISVSPEDDVELRRICLTNIGWRTRAIELTSYAEVVLAPPASDVAHPAFSNLFVQSEWSEERQALLCSRRPRSAGEKPPWMFHLMSVQGPKINPATYETSRDAFIGRGGHISNPAAMHRPLLTNSVGSVLDPIVAIRSAVVIEPEATIKIHIVTGVAETREEALALAEKYGDRHAADRVFDLSWTHNQVLLRRLDATEADNQLYERLVSNILYSNPTMRALPSVIARNRGGQAALWPFSISGDLPIALLRIADRENLTLVRQMVQAHAYWRNKGVASDLVIWNEDSSGYRQVLQEEILGIITAIGEVGSINQSGGIFVRRSEQLSEEDKVLMQTVARLIVRDSDGSLAQQMGRHPLKEPPTHRLVPTRDAAPRARAPANIEARNLAAWNGKGGFTQDGREYVIFTSANSRTPAPWINVLANPYFGTIVSESGGSYTWYENARTYRLTPWYNDPVADASGEALYLRDEEDGQFWSPTPLPAGGTQTYVTRHGFGYSAFEYREDGISSTLQIFVALDAPVKFLQCTLKNESGRRRRLSLTSFFELVLGEQRANNVPHIVTEIDPASSAILARNAYSNEFAGRIVFLDCSESQRTLSGDRLEFIGRNRNLIRPECMTRSHLSGRVGAGLDPCLAMQTHVDLADGEEREVIFVLGSGRDLADAQILLRRFHGKAAARSCLEAVWTYWKTTLGAVSVQTPDVALNVLANGWLLYQVLACRLWGRSGFYQSGGAFGFRDQLQDAMALVHCEPSILREQILRSAARQFCEGDVQHWWHPPMGRGVRTRISDDYLFLPSAVCRYITATGDTGVLDEQVSFLEGRSVKSDEDSYYDLPLHSGEEDTLYEHCVRAIKNGLNVGVHGLPLMGSGDWNDGMNLVGIEGKGESVWLAFFLYDVLERFAPLAEQRSDASFAETCRQRASLLRENIEAHTWDGQWYRRAFFDNGEPLGSAANTECKIDVLPQSWAVLSGAGDPQRSRQAMASLDEHLVRRDLDLISLFTPPFDRCEPTPGYIRGYLPGVRENGGQYTHAAVWAIMAFAALDQTEKAWELFHRINPINHGNDAAKIERYKVEPYVVAADVYTNVQHEGRGGWTWYTGSAAWMYRLILESLLGLRLESNRLHLDPKMPPTWHSFVVHYRYRNTIHHIHVRSLGGGSAILRIVQDGREHRQPTITLSDDRAEHHINVELGHI